MKYCNWYCRSFNWNTKQHAPYTNISQPSSLNTRVFLVIFVNQYQPTICRMSCLTSTNFYVHVYTLVSEENVTLKHQLRVACLNTTEKQNSKHQLRVAYLNTTEKQNSQHQLRSPYRDIYYIDLESNKQLWLVNQCIITRVDRWPILFQCLTI